MTQHNQGGPPACSLLAMSTGARAWQGRPLGPQAALSASWRPASRPSGAQRRKVFQPGCPARTCPQQEPPPCPPPASAPDGHEHGGPEGLPAQDTKGFRARPGGGVGKEALPAPPGHPPLLGGPGHAPTGHPVLRGQRGRSSCLPLVCRAAGPAPGLEADSRSLAKAFVLSVSIRPANR